MHAPDIAASKRQRWHGRVLRALIVCGLTWVWIAGMALVWVGCSSGPEAVEYRDDLTTGEEIQNVATFPFRVAGGAVVYPLRFLFSDLPRAIGNLFSGPLDDTVEQLKDKNPAKRELAVLELGDSEDPEAVAPLIPATDDPSELVRRQALLALYRLAAGLDVQAKRTLKQTALKRLADPAPAVRAAAAFLLGRTGDDATVPLLTQRSHDVEELPFVRAFCVLARGELGDWSVAPEALALARDATLQPVIRGNALLALGYLRSVHGVTLALALLDDADERIMTAAVTALAVAGELPRLANRLDDATAAGRPALKEKILLALGEYGRRAYVPLLQRYSRSPEARLRIHALFALAAAGHRPAVEPLIGVLDEPDAWSRLWALTWLMRLTHERFGIEPEAWRVWWREQGNDFLANGPNR